MTRLILTALGRFAAGPLLPQAAPSRSCVGHLATMSLRDGGARRCCERRELAHAIEWRIDGAHLDSSRH